MKEPGGDRAAAGYRVGDRYELTALIATGGMAQVWRAQDTVLGRPVAVKILHPHLATDGAFLLRFRREAVAAARLSHSSIVAIYDTVSADEIEAIVMELIDGDTLRAVLDRNGRLSQTDTVDLGIQIAEALDEAHRGGVVHRDIKPSNILLCSDRRVMVTDFGIAKAGEDTDLTVTGTLLGTAKYLAPEQVQGDEVDPRSDLYALGVVLFESLAGQAPFRAETDAATALARLHSDPPALSQLRPDVDPALEAVVMRLLARRPDDRVDRARDVRAALSGIVGIDVDADPTVVDPGAMSGTEAHPASTSTRGAEIPAALDRSKQHPDLEEPSSRNETGEADGFVRSERSWLIPAFVVLLLAGALVMAAALFTRSPLTPSDSDDSGAEATSGVGAETDRTTAPDVAAPVDGGVVGATSFDPEGDGSENEDLVGHAFDGDRDTSWRTETYRSASFGRLKSGVGLVLDLGGRVEVSKIEFTSPSIAWAVEIYADVGLSTPPQAWGDPLATVNYAGDDDVGVEIPPTSATTVLFWITDHGISQERDENPLPDFRFELAEITVS